MTARTATRRRLDGARVAHLCTSVTLPSGEVWSSHCRRMWPKGATRSAEGCPLCPECAIVDRRAYDYQNAVGVVEQPESEDR